MIAPQFVVTDDKQLALTQKSRQILQHSGRYSGMDPDLGEVVVMEMAWMRHTWPEGDLTLL